MAKYHLRDNGEPGKCVAQPGNCEYGSKDDPEFNHYDSPETARSAFEREQENNVQEPLTGRKAFAAKAVDRAITAPLGYDGDNPQWIIDKIKKASEMWGDAWEPARIIDTVNSPVGGLALV